LILLVLSISVFLDLGYGFEEDDLRAPLTAWDVARALLDLETLVLPLPKRGKEIGGVAPLLSHQLQ
jgi:hypothetical protein